MPTLHTVNKSPFERSAMASCLNHVTDGDSVLMIEDAVVGARKGTALADDLRDRQRTCALYVLGPDLVARGLKPDDLIEGITVVDYAGFVDLAARNMRVCAWL
ncbi:sulfurtransferase complex subunit TusB [Blastochloris sulfoviridis]|uniref:Sulfurtransferase complex subunit TusB n=1 Tax=Blastochloris sulfoviridis TaxID=50712 RepID=A0A5M6I2J8_9HYPH|nr:sulfurtransferase complex subunit TusB [Blastochloris sulfoviridis]KAA5602421.1 sulfurtransferase complex subunit TusB [Blastochloris sulfoviridis]